MGDNILTLILSVVAGIVSNGIYDVLREWVDDREADIPDHENGSL